MYADASATGASTTCLRPSHPGVNHKRVNRLYTAANLAVREAQEGSAARIRARAAAVGTRRQRRVEHGLRQRQPEHGAAQSKCLTVADDFSHECVDIAVDWGISGEYVTRMLDRAALFRGYPKAVRTDNGPEFTSRAYMAWAQAHGIRHILIEPGRPMRKRLHRELQRQVQRRMPERAMVPRSAASKDSLQGLAPGLQRGQAAQQLRTYATSEVRRAASPACGRCSSNTFNHRDQLTLQPRTSSE